MHTYLDCLSCLLQRATFALRQSGLDLEKQAAIIKKIMIALADTDISLGPTEMQKRTYDIIRQEGKILDPLENIKSYNIDLALRAYPELKHTMSESKDRFNTAVRIAMAGNIIDHKKDKEKSDNLTLFRSIEDALTQPLAIDHIAQLKAEVDKASKILFLADNAAETVFDRVLIEELPMDRITYVVRSTPVSHDATLRDAEFAGLKDLVEIITQGGDYPCVSLNTCSREFMDAFESADLIISKGQDNCSSLGHLDKNIFFMVRIRCIVRANEFNLSVGDFFVKGLGVKD